MIKTVTGQKGTSYRWEVGARPWSDTKAPKARKERRICYCDTEEQIAICLSCPRKVCGGSAKCSWLLWKSNPENTS